MMLTENVSTLGTNVTAAVGVNSSLERMITIIGSLLGAGACSYIARLLGAKDDEHANKVLSTSFFTGLGLGVVFLIFGKLLMGHMFCGWERQRNVLNIPCSMQTMYCTPRRL